jgi:site-specific recombinase XerD
MSQRSDLLSFPSAMSPNEMTWLEWERTLRQRGRSPKTIKSYREAVGQLAAFHHGKDVLTLGKGEIESYLLDVLERFTASTAATRFRGLQQCYRWAVEEEIIETSPMARMHPPAIPEVPVPIVPLDDLRLLLKVCEGRGFTERRDTAVIRLFCEPGGLRLSELTNLQVEDVDLRLDAVSVSGKGNRLRVVPYGMKTGQALSRYLRVRAGHSAATSSALWLGAKAVPLTTSGVAQMVERRCSQAGISKIHPHQLRHTAAHLWLEAGGSEGAALKLFGWRSREMLSRYGASLADQRAQESARKLAVGDRL